MKLYAVGIGPGDAEYLAPRAREVILDCDCIVGYSGYMKLMGELASGKELIATGMTGENERCKTAIQEALSGKKVCVVSSGDAGIYGMATLLYELAEAHPSLEVEVVPGITAAISAAAILGSPLANDFAVISLSDLLTPWEVIEKRLDLCNMADMAICIYNPSSKKRSDYLMKACQIALRHKPGGTKCGYVRNALRGEDSQALVLTLEELSSAQVDMFTTVIIGNSATRVIGGKLVTARGYRI
ncbi:MAG: precorrin-3B C(17)-methyltransferase [Eubacteriaceae bacterium]|nr:precorrin-3B C(17)-methyltransferase [Eubacteriaceae bacterium]